ncbi:MAG: amidase [Gammaproteobacteria bacterium RIFCSPHIGHO2_12_FULL_38_14]|nr:MAG: amidase [Gammaproteobacteria bacterium RIFCSPHIGHO2_12_FULL_38_14]
MIFKFTLSQLISGVCLSAILINFVHAGNSNQQENCLPFLSGLPNQTNMMAPPKNASSKVMTYLLPATPATSQWGVFDSNQAPVLRINPGDTVNIETMAASYNQVVPGTTIDQIIQMNDAVPNRGPHTLTGPIYINGAELGDVLRIHINRIIPRSYASNDAVPGKGLFPKEFTDGYVKYFYLDLKKMQMQFAPGIVVPIRPFPGIVAVARQEPGQYDSIPPGPFGGNMDLRELTEGTTLYLPVFMKGGLLWTGDSHAGQGNGEIDLTAIETAFDEFNITIDLIKQKPLTWPRIETKDAWIAVGYDKDLNKAFDILKNETIKLITEVRKTSPDGAEKMMLNTWNCPISEVVNGVQGVYCMVPKSGNIKSADLPKVDNAKFFVSYAEDADLEQAMRKASMFMLNKIVSEKKLSRIDAYTLASFAMDCRIGRPVSNMKAVHCMMAKNLWT